MQNYSLSTVCMIVFFALYAIAAFGLWAAPAWLMGIVAAGIALFLLVRK